MVTEIETLVAEYSRWLREQFTCREIGEWTEITTPFLDRHNDYLQVYARRSGDGFELTDDGYVIADLAMSGCELDTAHRSALLAETLSGFAVTRDGEALVVRASAASFAQRKHDLIQAMLSVGDLFCLAQPMVKSLFMEDVRQWLDLRDVRNASGVVRVGRSGFNHRFHFLVPKSRREPERYVQTFARPDKQGATGFIFSWMDTDATRPADSRAYVLLNDTESRVPPDVVSALSSYGIRGIGWTERDQIADELAA